MMPLTAYDRRRRGDEEEALAKQRLAREVQRDERNAGREDQSLALRREEMGRSDKRAGQREDLYRTQENRREQQAMFERQHMQSLEDEALFRQLQNATTPWEAEAAAQALERKGYTVRRPDAESPALTPLAPPVVPPPAAPAPMSKGDAATSAALDQADVKYSKGLGVKSGLGGRTAARAPKPPAKDAKLSAELDAADQTYSRGLGVTPGGLGAPPLQRRQSLDVPLSDAMLSPDDPYNRLVR
jgi:hypothetical protein